MFKLTVRLYGDVGDIIKDSNRTQVKGFRAAVSLSTVHVLLITIALAGLQLPQGALHQLREVVRQVPVGPVDYRSWGSRVILL